MRWHFTGIRMVEGEHAYGQRLMEQQADCFAKQRPHDEIGSIRNGLLIGVQGTLGRFARVIGAQLRALAAVVGKIRGEKSIKNRLGNAGDRPTQRQDQRNLARRVVALAVQVVVGIWD